MNVRSIRVRSTLASLLAVQSTLVAAILAATSLTAVGPVLAEDERADLKLEILGAPLTGSQRDITIRITNISAWWADETKLRVETVSPGPANVMNRDVENLDPGQVVTFKYTIGGACNNHVVKAEVSAALNWDKVPEGNTSNNQLQLALCPPPPPPGSSGGPAASTRRGGPIVADPVVVTKPVPSEQLLQEHLRPGTHTLEFPPKEALTVWNFRGWSVGTGWKPVESLSRREPLSVGWNQTEEAAGLSASYAAYQVLIRFDLDKLDEVETKLVSRATLIFVEQAQLWNDADGDKENKTGCAVTLARFRFDTDLNSARGLIETEYVNDIPAGPSTPAGQPLEREVDVTSFLLGYVANPAFFSVQPNFVLRGEHDQLEADDDEDCVSTISNVRLRVTYVVPNR